MFVDSCEKNGKEDPNSSVVERGRRISNKGRSRGCKNVRQTVTGRKKIQRK